MSLIEQGVWVGFTIWEWVDERVFLRSTMAVEQWEKNDMIDNVFSLVINDAGDNV